MFSRQGMLLSKADKTVFQVNLKKSNNGIDYDMQLNFKK